MQLLIIMSNILAAFKMEKAIGPDGRPVETDFKYYDLIR